MGDFEEKLNAILSDPGAMAQVASLAQSLHLGESTDQAAAEESTRERHDRAPSSPFQDLLSGVDPGTVSRLLPLLGELRGGGDDQRSQLLHALRPFLKPERQDKIDRALSTARLLQVGKKALHLMGDGHV